jgi:tripartite ATP-independent transporter DctP family solute receptor
MLTRRGLGILGMASLAAGCAPRPATGRGTFTAADVHPDGHPVVEAMRWMNDELSRLTDGRLSMDIYPSGQLGAEDDSIGLARFQAVDMCRVAAAALNNAFPETRLWALPYVFQSVQHMRAVVDGGVGHDLLNVFEGRGLVGLAYYDAAPRCLYNVRHPVREPGELRGLKIRAPNSDIFLEMLAAMGANPTPLSFGGVFSALQTHLIDGAENNWPSYQSSRQYEVAHFWSDSQHCFSPDALLMSKGAFDALSGADQELVRDVARRSVAVQRTLWDERSATAQAEVVAAGVQVSSVDRPAFEASVRPLLERYLRDPVLRGLYDRVQALA